MALHFSRDEFAAREARTLEAMKARKLDAMLIFAQESSYWLTGYDTFGFCFFQCLVLKSDGRKALLTRSADLRQARHTSIIEDIRIWVDRGEASPIVQLKDMLFDLELLGCRLGVEYDTHGLTARNGRLFDDNLSTFADLVDASDLIPALRAVKSPAEIVYVREAARLADLAYEAALAEIRPGADEGRILSAMQGAIFDGGGDYPANEFIIGSGADALLCRYKAGRRALSERDQITLEWAGVYRHYHVAMMRTVCTGEPTDRHRELHEAAVAALAAVEAELRPGRTFGDVFDAHARVFDERGLFEHRLNACGYSLGARFTPSWMDMPMFYRGNPAPILPNMVLFTHMILMDSATNTAMCLGRTCLTTEADPEPLSVASLDLISRT
ncbi:M24 family metallopeptidase [Prosthecodimorpha staleyi]|uniref:Xaa-Pro peptidase family protein n=1 Tax=Prosthecodimorpha staleyi TaxID=2840188 RepID=A0A947D1H3_9HYPH|nr:Xaa-Pro peptidase family protein [Prosthecodimorpha staleyi]MBT9289215.1 Xaa-Pro peptidase family protein [Prosthecodimorpha staleyi]